MAKFQRTSEDMIIIEGGSDFYVDTVANFELDLVEVNGDPLPVLPDILIGYYYSPTETSYCTQKDIYAQLPLSLANVDSTLLDSYIASIDDFITAKTAREEA